MHPEEDEVLTYDIARMCSIKVTMAIDLKNQKQGTIERAQSAQDQSDSTSWA